MCEMLAHGCGENVSPFEYLHLTVYFLVFFVVVVVLVSAIIPASIGSSASSGIICTELSELASVISSDADTHKKTNKN